MGLVRGGGGKELFKYIPARRPGHMTTEGVARLITYQRGDTIRVRDGFSPRFHDDCSHRALWRFISCRTLPSRPLSWSIPHTHSPPSKVFAIRILFCMKSAARCRWNNSPTFCGNYSGKARYEILLSPVSHYIITYLPSHKISQLFSARFFLFYFDCWILIEFKTLIYQNLRYFSPHSKIQAARGIIFGFYSSSAIRCTRFKKSNVYSNTYYLFINIDFQF